MEALQIIECAFSFISSSTTMKNSTCLLVFLVMISILTLSTATIRLGVVYNTSIIASTSKSFMIYGNCKQCFCNISQNFRNATSFNCFLNNNTCQVFTESIDEMNIKIVQNSNTIFYFLQNPLDYTTHPIDLTSESSRTHTSIQSSNLSYVVELSLFYILVATATTTLPSFTYSSLACSTISNYFLSYTRATAPSIWESISHDFTAVSDTSTIIFAIKTNSQQVWFVDNVSVVSHKNSATSLLINGGFDTGDFTGWSLTRCTAGCSTGADITRTSSCFNSPCYRVPSSCYDYQFLRQTFYTTIGEKYLITFSIGFDGGRGSEVVDTKVGII